MSQFLLFVLLGLGPGALIAAVALGIVLMFRGSGMINLATGAMAMFGAYVFYGLRTGGYLFLSELDLGGPLDTAPAFVVALAVCALTGVVFETVVLRRLRAASPLAKLVASLGLLLVLQAAVLLRFGTTGQRAPQVLPDLGSVPILDVSVPGDRFQLLGIVLVITVVLAVLYRYSRFGLATRAAQENEGAAMLAGLSPNWISLTNTVLAFVLAGGLGVLVAPTTQLDAVTLAFVVVPALGAALLARFTSFSIAAGAGIAMGIIQTLVLWVQSKSWFPTVGNLPPPGVTELLYFLIIVGALFWRGARLPERGAVVEPRLPAAPRARWAVAPAGVLAAAGAIALLTFPFDFRQALINSLIGFVVCLSLVVITGFVGQVSLVQIALGGVTGFAISHLAVQAGIGFPLAPLIGIAVAVVFGLVAAVSALRVRGVNLAIVTIAAAVALERFGFDNTSWGGGVTGAPVPSPKIFGANLGPSGAFPLGDDNLPSPVFGFVCLVVAVALALLVANLRRSVIGQQMLAVRSNERAAAAAGISVRNIKLAAFGLSSAIAGAAGALYAYNFASVTAARFGILTALSFIAFTYIGGITTVAGAVVGGLIVIEGLGFHAIQEWTGLPSRWELMFAGLALIATVVVHPEGIAGAASAGLRRGLAKLQGRRPVAPLPAESGES